VSLAGRVLVSVVGVAIVWLAITMALSPALIVPIPKHGEPPQRVLYEPTLTTEVARYVSAGLLAFLGVTIAAAPWRRRLAPPKAER
jgi:Na+-transporting methylmalonyl-CoA/oxaloacetate decarboxylase beta subunit